MSVNERPVYNSANLAMFMVNVSQALMRPMRAQWPAFSVNDLKAWFRGQKYVVETFKLLPLKFVSPCPATIGPPFIIILPPEMFNVP